MSADRVLVTGASGFIGRRLTDALMKKGLSVMAVGRERARLPDATERVEAEDAAAVCRCIVRAKPDMIFHLAAYGIQPADRDPASMYRVNVEMTVEMVRAAIEAGVGGFVYAGSCSEYAPLAPPLLLAEESALGMDNLYGASKAAAGLYGRALARLSGLPFVWLRLFGIYGPGEADHRLIPYLVGKLRACEAVDLTPGLQQRDMVHIDDAVQSLTACEELLGQGGGVYNICTGRPISVREVALLVADAMGSDPKLLKFGRRPYRADENPWLVGDPARFRDATGWSARTDPAAGIRSMIQ